MKHKKLPLVTIITPAYNRADLIEETIKSILDQKYPNLEYIIIDDGSKDDTYKVIQKYASKRVHVFTQKNMGETRTVNKGFSFAKGEIIAVINSDDPLLPSSIQTMVAYMEEHPRVLAVYPDWVMIDSNGKNIQKVHLAEYSYRKMLAEHYCIPGPGTFFRRKAIELTGGRNVAFRYIADFAFWLKLGMYGPLAHIPKTLATFRVHAGSQGIYAKGELMAAEHKKLVDWIFADKDIPTEALVDKGQAYSSAYFHAAKESTKFLRVMLFYFFSFFANPTTFMRKIRYEIVKKIHTYKHFLIRE